MRKVEEYVRAASAAAIQLGLTPSNSTPARPKASWTSFLHAAGQLAAPLASLVVSGQEGGLIPLLSSIITNANPLQASSVITNANPLQAEPMPPLDLVPSSLTAVSMTARSNVSTTSELHGSPQAGLLPPW